MDAEHVLDLEDSLSAFDAEDPEWSAARSAARLSAREISNPLDLFPSEAEELAAHEPVGTGCTAAAFACLSAEFDIIDDEIETAACIVAEPAVARTSWVPARVAVIMALTMFMSASAANDRRSDRPIAPAVLATTTARDLRLEKPHLPITNRETAAVVVPMDGARPKMPAIVATTGRSSSQPRRDVRSRQPNIVTLPAAASEPPITLAPTATSALDTAPIVSPPPPPRILPTTNTATAPSATVAPSPIAVPPEPSVGRSDADAVRAVLDRYQSAFTHLDASRAKAVWPSVDEKALGRAFGQLERQQVVLEQCDVKIAGQRAAATCGGRASYVPRVGSKAARNEDRRWAFTLRKTGDDWIIEAIELAPSR